MLARGINGRGKEMQEKEVDEIRSHPRAMCISWDVVYYQTIWCIVKLATVVDVLSLLSFEIRSIR